MMQKNIVFNKTVNWNLVGAVLSLNFLSTSSWIGCFFTPHQLYRSKTTFNSLEKKTRACKKERSNMALYKLTIKLCGYK